MASTTDRMRLATPGGVPFAVYENSPSLKYSPTNATGDAKFIIQSSDIEPFASEVFPVPYFNAMGQIVIPPKMRFPGIPTLVASEISFDALDQTKPLNINLFDTSSPEGTYGDLVIATVSFETVTNEPGDGSDGSGDPEMDPGDPTTFLEHTVNVGGEFLTLNSPNDLWENEGGSGQAPPNEQSAEEAQQQQQITYTINDDLADQLQQILKTQDPAAIPGANPKGKKLEENRDFRIPRTIVFPLMEHSLTWRECVDPPWHDIRACLGKVNDRQLAFLFDAVPETVLFLGVSAKQEYTARRGVPYVMRRPWTMTFKFSERHLEYVDHRPDIPIEKMVTVVGWNHFWRTGDKERPSRWERLVNSLGERAYSSVNFERMFRRGNRDR